MRTFLQRITLYLFLLFLPGVASAQQSPDTGKKADPEKEGKKIGLALSGGGAKGFAHIGVLKVFEDEGIPVHVVSGTSMGAVVGSLYAIGYTPEEIEDIALSTDWNILFNDSYRINPQNIANSVSTKDTYLFTFPFNGRRLTLPAGLIDGQNISMMLYRLTLPYHGVQDFKKLPIPFAAVATNLATGEAHTFTKGYLPDAVRASIAIPTIFKPVKIGGETFIDGGVSRNIPAEDARKLGADIVISSDVGEPVKNVDSLDTFVDVLFQSVGFHQRESDMAQKKMTDIYLRPDIDEFSSFSYGKVQAIIERGEKAARKVIPKLKSYLADSTVLPSQFKSITPKADSLLISEVSFPNISGLLQQQTNLALDIQLPSTLTLSDIEKKVNRLYSSGLFSQVSYRLQEEEADSNRSNLVLEFQQKEPEYAGFSVRYDSKYKASLLFGTSFTDNIFWSDRLNMQLRVGEILELNAGYSTPVTLAPLSKVNVGVNFQRSPIDFYSHNQALSTIEVEKLGFRPSASVRLFERTDFEAGMESELYNLNEAVGNTLVLENISLLLKPFFNIKYSTLNRPYFPTRGQSLILNTEISDKLWASSTNFIQFTANWFSTLRLRKKLNLSNQIFAGYSSSASIPLHYYYYLGGMTSNPVFNLRQQPFMGHAAQQLRSQNVIALRSELQLGLGRKIYLSGGWNAAHLSDIWTFNIDSNRMEFGYSLSLGATSIIGPLELSLSTPNFSGQYALKIDIGYHF